MSRVLFLCLAAAQDSLNTDESHPQFLQNKDLYVLCTLIGSAYKGCELPQLERIKFTGFVKINILVSGGAGSYWSPAGHPQPSL